MADTQNNKLYSIKEETLNKIADTIREQSSTSEEIKVSDFSKEIRNACDYQYSRGRKMVGALLGKTITEIHESDLEGVTKIGPYAFSDCTSLITAEIPESVISIGEEAFYNCSSLTSINLPEGVTSIGYGAFEGCDSIISIVIPDSVTFIGKSTFSSCGGLTSVVIPNSVTIIGELAFNWCTSLPSVVIPDSVTSIGEWAFYVCASLTSVTIGDGVTNIGENAFRGCIQLTDVYYTGSATDWQGISIGSGNDPLTSATIHYNYIPGTSQGLAYTSNGDGTCYVSGIGSCIDTDVVIPSVSPDGDTVTGIGNKAFYDCSSLTTVVIPDSVTSIGAWAFYDCSSLTTVVIPDSVTSIDYQAFVYCSKLTIYCEATSKPSGWDSDWNSRRPVVWGYTGINGVTEVGLKWGTTANGVTIGGYVGSATAITIPETLNDMTVTNISQGAFEDCNGLISVVIPDGVTSIGKYAFGWCDSLTSVVIPDSVTSIGDDAFAYSYGLTIYCEATAQPSGWSSSWNSTNRPVVWGYTIDQ